MGALPVGAPKQFLIWVNRDFMSSRRDWDKARKYQIVWERGGLPFWQEGWAPEGRDKSPSQPSCQPHSEHPVASNKPFSLSIQWFATADSKASPFIDGDGVEYRPLKRSCVYEFFGFPESEIDIICRTASSIFRSDVEFDLGEALDGWDEFLKPRYGFRIADEITSKHCITFKTSFRYQVKKANFRK